MGARDGTPRSAGSRSASKFSALAGFVSLQGFIGERVQLAGTYVAFQLAVPHKGVELMEPLPEYSQLLGGQRLDLFLDGLDLVPGCNLSPWARAG
jgi:hypothetical protein